jgi:hypothetical protein
MLAARVSCVLASQVGFSTCTSDSCTRLQGFGQRRTDLVQASCATEEYVNVELGDLIKSPLTHSQSDWVQDAAMESWALITIQKSAKADEIGETWNTCHQRRPLLLYIGDGNPHHEPGVGKFCPRAASGRGRKGRGRGGVSS